MPYVTRQQVESKLPPPILIEALDDDGDGNEDQGQFNNIVATAAQEVDAYLAGLYTVPFADPAPAKVCEAALCFVLEAIYGRRATGGDARNPNPWKTQAKFWRDHLQKVGNRELPFDAAIDKAFTPGAVIVDDMATNAQST